jgi:acyl carrier protein
MEKITTNNCQKSINEFILNRHNLEPDDLRIEVRLKQDLGFDSLDSVELLMFCEKLINVSISDNEWFELKTLGDIYTLVESKIQE